MNLNPLFFNKLNIEADLSKSISPVNETQTYLFADIINVSSENLSIDNRSVQSSTIDLLLANINDLEIDIHVSKEQLSELKKFLSNPSFSKENSSHDLYHLENTDIIKTRQLISEPELAFFITGINKIINNIVPEAGLDTISSLNELSANPELAGSEIDLPEDLITLDLLTTALHNHDQVKFTFKSGLEKITYQVSIPGEIKNTDLTSYTSPFVQNPEMEISKPNDPELNFIAEKEVLPANSTKVENATIESEQDSITTDKTQINTPVTEFEKEADRVETENSNITSKIYKIEGYYSENRNSTTGPVKPITTPFILDINTSKEIGLFLNKYNYEKELTSKNLEIVTNQQVLNESEQSSQKVIKEESVSTLSAKESNLQLVNSDELKGDLETKNSNQLSIKDSSEYLRSIKIETGSTVSEFKKNSVVDKVETNEKNSVPDSLGKSIPEEPVKKGISANTESTLKENDSTIEEKLQLRNEKRPEVVIKDEKSETVSNRTIQTENVNNVKEFNVPVILGKTGENIPVKNKFSNKVNVSEAITNPDDKPEVDNNETSKTANVLVKDFKNTETNVSFKPMTQDSKVIPSEMNSDDLKENNNKAINFSKSEEPERLDSNTASSKDTIRHNEIQSQSTFNKKIDQVDKLNNKMVSDFTTFKETVKKVKSSDMISEINKYLLSNEKQSITFQLTPKNLGAVKLVVEYVDNQVSANIEVENEQVKQTVQSNLEQLRNTLQNNGIQLNNINVSLSNGEPRAQKQFSQKRKNYSGSSGIKVDQKSDLSGKKKMGYNTYEFLA